MWVSSGQEDEDYGNWPTVPRSLLSLSAIDVNIPGELCPAPRSWYDSSRRTW
jgi:hypothetical protein